MSDIHVVLRNLIHDSGTRVEKSAAIGVFFAIFATFSWALNFVGPYVTGDYTAYDFISLRFLFSGVLGAVFVFVYRASLVFIGWQDILLAGCLGLLGYVGYIACIMGGVIFAGPVVPPAFLGLAPILLAILGNTRQKTLPWAKLGIPLTLVAGGLLFANIGSFLRAEGPPGISPVVGVVFSMGALTLWLLFSFLNQIALERNPRIHAGIWTGLMMVGASVGIILLLPFGMALELFNLPTRGFGWQNAGQLYLWAFGLASISSVVGAWAWNVASQRLPIVVTGQLISIETIFATAFGLIMQRRIPAIVEIAGIILLVAGAVIVVRIVLSPDEHLENSTTESSDIVNLYGADD
jgi:drug/metabolite transporter (DMT)-like permease